MKLPNNFNRKQDERGGVAAVRRFLIRHGEKCAAGVLIATAIGLALQAALQYQPLPWQPDELETLADNTENTIKNSERSIADENIKLFDYATYAEQIKEPILSEPYRNDVEWNLALLPSPQLRGGFEVLTAEALRGEAIRRIGLSAPEQWQPPLVPGASPLLNDAAIWINVYGTIPLWQQQDIYNQVYANTSESNRPEYVYYELERAELKPKEELVWQPVIVYPEGEIQVHYELDASFDFQPDRLVPFGQQGTAREQYAESFLVFSDFAIEPAKTYTYRMRLYLLNPNYGLQESSVEEGVDTKNQLTRSDWSSFAKVHVPDQVSVQIRTVFPTDPSEFPRQTGPLRPIKGTLILDYFDVKLGQSLPPVEKRDVVRGMLINMAKDEAIRFINRGKPADEVVEVNYPDVGLRSDVCVLDFMGGRKLQKTPSREAQTSPELFAPGKALLLMPDGTMQITTTNQEMFR